MDTIIATLLIIVITVVAALFIYQFFGDIMNATLGGSVSMRDNLFKQMDTDVENWTAQYADQGSP